VLPDAVNAPAGYQSSLVGCPRQSVTGLAPFQFGRTSKPRPCVAHLLH
jgi:hypothetical protein